ncbi:MAG: barstar family protein [Elusimicrobia bacterium]|nr:barstar family protein [Elusimicrobiota bacterium]
MDWRNLLADAGGKAVLRLDGPPQELAAAEAAADELGFFRARIDGKGAPDKEALLCRLGEALRFPDYFGGNWDALSDCLTDMDGWIDNPGFLLVFTDSGDICREKPEDSAVFLDILESAAGFWREQDPPRPFKAVLA